MTIAEQFYAAGQKLATVSGSGVADLLNRQLNSLIGPDFKAGPGSSMDSHGRRTGTFGTLVRKIGKNDSTAAAVEVAAEATACVIEVCDTLDLENFRNACGRIADAKQLIKTPRPRRGVDEMSATLGIVFAINSNVSLEELAKELEQIDTRTANRQWVDMIVILNRGTIQYGMQFPGEGIAGDFLPSAEGAEEGPIPPIYIVVTVQPAKNYSFNKMGAFLVAHLTLFARDARLPAFDEVSTGVPKEVLTIGGFQYNLRGELVPVPEHLYQGRHIPQFPVQIESAKGEVLATVQFWPWQEGGIVILKGKLPLEAISVFLGPEALSSGGVNRPGARITNVLPITWVHFVAMLQKLQQQSNFVIRHEPPKMIFQKMTDEGTTSPFVARLFFGILNFRDDVFKDEIKRLEFDAAFSSVITELQNARATLGELEKTLQDHVRRVANGEVARIRGNSIEIDENIDRQSSKLLEDFLNASVRAIKHGMQTLIQTLQVDIGFLFQKQNRFVQALAVLTQSDTALADYLEKVRPWSEHLVNLRNNVEHNGWKLTKVKYVAGPKVVTAELPEIEGQKVLEFVAFMLDRLFCLTEDVAVHCLQKHMPTGISITEIALDERDPKCCVRFQRTTISGGTPIWRIRYHQTKFEET